MATPAAEPEPEDSGAGALAAEWFKAYTGYLKTTASHSADTVDLYQQFIDRVARQDLAPTATQEMLTAFVESRGSAYSDELARVNTRFFSELVRLSASLAQELGRVILPEAAVALTSPPLFDATDPARWFQELSDYSRRLAENLGTTYEAMRERATNGDADPGDVQAAAAEHLQRRLPEYLSEMARLYFGLLTDLTNLRVRSEQEFLRGVLARSDGTDDEGALELTLVGTLGETAQASFSIGNTRNEPTCVRCQGAEVRRADGIGPAFEPDLTVAPDGLDLAPGEEGRLTLMLRLHEGNYEPGILYVSTLRIAGHDEPRLEVPIRITATQPPASRAS